LKGPITNIEKSFRRNESLAKYTTYQIGGPAELFLTANSREELISALLYANKNSVPVTVIGGGSNLLISDKGVKGLVVLNRANHYEFQNDELSTESGTILSKVARESIELGLSGLDFATGIPGTVGGAIVGNAGAYGKEIAGSLIEAEIWNGEVKVYKNEDFHFKYRYSDLKGSNKIVLSARFKFEKGDKEAMFEKIKTDLERRVKLYKGLNCGSYFKNPEGESAGAMIDRAGMKGFRSGNAQVNPNHANVILNLGGARAKEIIELENHIIKEVKDKFEVTLEPEVVKIGF
jgi:UDP-N-acetylmuramate dehydrogenase